MTVALHAVCRGAIEELYLLSVMPELSEIVLPEDVCHHFCRQFFPDFITGFGISRIVEQIGGGDFIHRPAHFQPANLRVISHHFCFQADKTVRMRRSGEG
ncbi:hypothetical protein D3C78_1380960 [compost metagenome]